MQSQQEIHYSPDIAAKAVIELTAAMRGRKDMEYAKALLNDPRMTSNYGMMASCGLTTRDIKRAKDLMPEILPTLGTQRRAADYLNILDHEQEVWRGGQ